MRVAYVLAGVSGLVATTSSLATAGVVWQTVIGDGQAIGSEQNPSDTVDTFESAFQVVVGPGGSIAVSAQGSDPNDTNYVLYEAAGSNTLQTLASGGDMVNNHEIDDFGNLALSSNPSSGTRVTYLAGPGGGGFAGLYQQDIGSAVQEVAYKANSNDLDTVPIQVNSGGQVIYEGTDSNGAAVFLGSAGTTATTLFTASNGSGNLTSTSNRLGLYANGLGWGVISNSTVNLSALSGTASSVSGSATVGQLLAATSFGSTGAVIYTTTDASNPNQTDLEYYNGSTTPIGSFIGSSASANSPQVAAELAVNPSEAINAAYYQPDSDGGTLRFFNGTSSSIIATTSSATSPVDHAIDPLNPGADDVIEQLSVLLSTPMVNDNGIVVFDGEIEDASLAVPVEHQALLEWDNGQLTVLLQQGQTLAGLGTVDGILVNSLTSESDVLKDSLSDDNYLAAIVSLDDGNDAVIETLLPEPTIALSLAMVAAPLLLRRRRRAGELLVQD